MNSESALRVTTPGRVCLFGEHQDYLRLPVIPCAISLRITIQGSQRDDREVKIHLPDIGGEEQFSLEGALPYVAERDYFRSVVNVLRRHGFSFSRGCECTVRGEIPINAGTSSSSALIVSWVGILARWSDQRRILSPDETARLAHEAEVVEFGEPGGMMDHFSTAYGGILFLDFEPRTSVDVLDAGLGTFVLGDSGEPKDTKGILARVKKQVLDVSGRLAGSHPGFSLRTTRREDLPVFAAALSAGQYALLDGTLANRDITLRARALLSGSPLDHETVGGLLNDHQAVLRDILKISTPKIDRMIHAALKAGALGAKINGSGGGGCMFAYAPGDSERVAEAVVREGGRAFVVTPAGGMTIEEGGVDT
jgi:galactokinase